MFWRINIHLLPKSPDVPYKMFFNTLQIMISKTLLRNNIFQSWATIGQLNDCLIVIKKMWYKMVKLLALCEKSLVNGGCGTTAGWKTSPYVHLLLGGKPQASCTPHSDLPGRVKNLQFWSSMIYYYIMVTNCLSISATYYFMRDGEMVKSEPCLDAQAKK